MTRREAEAVAADPEVRRVEANSVVQALVDGPLESFGVTKARLDAGVDGNADGAASYSKNDLVAAVIDTGIDAGHADLDGGKVIAFANCVGQPCAASAPVDDNGHGTLVSSVLAGTGDARADRLYQGVAPGAALVGVKVLDSNAFGTKATMIAGLDWVVANKDAYGIRVVNLSIGIPVDGPFGEGCSDGTDAFSVAVDRAVDAGLVVVAAAGNSGPRSCTIGAPAAAAKALTVGAMADLSVNGFKLAGFSGRGPTADGRTKPDVVAPGVEITSAKAGTTTEYLSANGTSSASPFVAGVALLMFDANPALTPQQLKAAVTSTAIDWGRGGDNAIAGSSGADVDYGAGRLDAYSAIRAAGAAINSAPTLPAHAVHDGSLAGTGSQVEYPFSITQTRFPIAGTLIVPQPAGGSDVALSLLDPSGVEVARATTQGGREAELGHRPTSVGTYTLRVTSLSGSAQYFVDVSADANRPPIPVAAADVTRGTAPLTVTFDASGSSDPDPGDTLTYAWDLDGDGAFDDGFGTGVSYVYALPGSYTVRLQVTDGAGATATASLAITVDAPGPPPLPSGLVAVYGFDEGIGTSVADASGKGNAGSISGATWTSPGKFGSALSFDGVNDWVTVADANSLDLSNALTLEAWVKPTAGGSSSWRTVLLKEQPGQLAYALYSASSAGPPAGHVYVGGETDARAPSALPLGVWTHLALSYDGSQLRLYKDGNEVASRNLSGAITTSSSALRIGGNNVWGEWFHGLIDEIRIYDHALTASEIQTDSQTAIGGGSPPPPPDTTPPTAPAGVFATTTVGSATLTWIGSTDNLAVAHYNLHRSQTANFTPTAGNRIAQPAGTSYTDSALAAGTYYYRVTAEDAAGNVSASSLEVTAVVPSGPPPPPPAGGLVAAYGFDEGQGSSVADASGKGNAGSISGASWTSGGKFGSALSFDGVNDWVTVADANSLDLSNALTLEAWVKPATLGGWRTVLLKERPGGLTYALYAHTSNQGPGLQAWMGSSEPEAASSTSLATSAWTHLAGTYDGAALRLYVNGALALSQATSGPIGASSGVLRIGGNSVWSEWFHGLIDEVRVYDRALTASEIQADMTRPVSGPPPPPDTSAPSAPTALSATTAVGSATLQWTASSDDVGVARYNVHRSQTESFTPSAANRVGQPTGTSFTDSALAAGTYYYRVTAEDAAGNVSAPSSEVTAIVPAAPPPPPPAGGLVAAYGFDEGMGTGVADASGKGNAGSISGATWTSGGRFGSALSFDGVNDWVTVADANSLDLTGALTLEAWVKPTTLGGWRTVLLKEQPGELVYALYAATSAGPPAGHVYVGGGEADAGAPAALPLGVWTHLALSYDGSQLRLYEDGNEVASRSLSGAIATSSGALRIGGNNVWGEWFHGLIDEIRIYDHALTAGEIQTDMTLPIGP